MENKTNKRKPLKTVCRCCGKIFYREYPNHNARYCSPNCREKGRIYHYKKRYENNKEKEKGAQKEKEIIKPITRTRTRKIKRVTERKEKDLLTYWSV